MDKLEEFRKAYDSCPSQDNEAYTPDRGSFKAGFFAAWNLLMNARQEAERDAEDQLRAVVSSDVVEAEHLCERFNSAHPGNFLRGWFGLGDTCPFCHLTFTTAAMPTSDDAIFYGCPEALDRQHYFTRPVGTREFFCERCEAHATQAQHDRLVAMLAAQSSSKSNGANDDKA